MSSDKNFVRLTQVISYLGKPDRIIEKVHPHDKDFLIRRMKRMVKNMPASFWYDLVRKNEAKAYDRFGGQIHYKIEPINGDYVDEEIKRIETSQRNQGRR